MVQKKTINFIILVILVTAGVFGAFLFIPSLSLATPTITWMPSSIEQTVSPGESRVVLVSFKSLKDLTNITVRVVPEVEQFIQIDPPMFGGITKDQKVDLTITISTPINSPSGTFEGTIHLRSLSNPKKTFAKPLPLTIRITDMGGLFEDPALGIVFEYPTFGQASLVEKKLTRQNNVMFDIKLLSPSGDAYVSQFGILLVSNENHLSLLDWFQQNVDLSGSLFSTGAFVQLTLASGIQALVLRGTIPDEHLGGPVSQIYALSSSGDNIIVMTQSQYNDLEFYGYPPNEQVSLLVAILESMVLP